MGLIRSKRGFFRFCGPEMWGYRDDPDMQPSFWDLEVSFPLKSTCANRIDWQGITCWCYLEDRKRAPSSKEWEILSKILAKDAHTVLSVGDIEQTTYGDFRFLEYFKDHRAFKFHIRNAETYGCLPEIAANLVSLSLSFTRKKLSLEFLRDAIKLKYFSLNHLGAGLKYIPYLTSLERLDLTTCSDKNDLTSLPKNLKQLQVLGGTFPGYEILLTAPKLEYLDLGKCKIGGDISVLGELKHLKLLHLSYVHGQELPDLSKLTKLEYLSIADMKGVTALAPITKIKKPKQLKRLVIWEMPDLKLEKIGDLEFYCRVPFARICHTSGKLCKQLESAVFSKYPQLEYLGPKDDVPFPSVSPYVRKNV